jgi:hypothetical protein
MFATHVDAHADCPDSNVQFGNVPPTVSCAQQIGLDCVHCPGPSHMIATPPSGQELMHVSVADIPPSAIVAQHTCPTLHVVFPHMTPASPSGVPLSLVLLSCDDESMCMPVSFDIDVSLAPLS